ncbi:MAG: LysM peptidoglycan-binding domain-containing protein, partial [Chloroflexi bacterium]|nr:LysM peptidoglycan-binding domain-containing protein [Chloroflexota bacterium]
LASPDILEGQQLYLPLLPTPTPCAVAPPPNWGPYTIQTGDTLFSLAAARGTTAEQIKQVNCLAAETIQIGQQLYLTLLPTPTPTFPPPPTLPPTALPTPVPPPAALPTPAQPLLSQPDTSAGVSPSQPGGDSTTIGQAQAPGADSSISGGQPSPGVDATSVEVQTSQGPANSSQPPSDFPPLVADLSDFYGPSPCPQGGSPFLKLRGASKVELGQRAYFFICNPPGKPTSALVTWPDGQTQQGADLFKVPFTDPKTNAKTSEVAIVWPALPFYPTGTYTVTVTSPASIPPLPFTITLPAKDRILAVPPVGFPGDTFQVYYVRVPATGGVITMIVGLKEPTSPQKPLSIGTDHLFKIDKAEWGMSPLYLGPTESPGDYVVSNDITKTFHANITLSPP